MKNSSQCSINDWLLGLSKRYQIPYLKIVELYNNVNGNQTQLLNYLDALENNKNLPQITIFNNGILVKDSFYDFSVDSNRELFKMLEKNEFDREVFEEVFGFGGQEENILIEKRNEFYHQALDLSELKRNITDVDENTKRIRRMSLEQEPRLIYKYVIGKGKVLRENSNMNIQPTFQENANVIDGTPDQKPNNSFSLEQATSNDSLTDGQSRLNHQNTLSPKVTVPKELSNLHTDIKLPESIVIGQEPRIKFKIVYKNKETVILADLNIKIGDLLSQLRSLLQVNVSLMLNGEILDDNESIVVLKHTVSYLI